jgi:integrase
MASLHKHSSGRSPFWFAKYRGADGRIVVKSTKQSDRRKALTVALEYERTASMGRDGVLTEAQVRKVLSEVLEKVTGDSFRHETVKDFLERWLRGKENAKSQGTHLRYGNSVKLFLESLGNRAHKSLAAVAPRDVEKFRDAELKIGKATSSVNVDIKTLRTAFNFARRQGLVPTNPVDAVELPAETRHQRDVFTPEQIRAILQTATGEWKTAILFGYYLGARLSDAVTMTWELIDLPGKTITYTQGKTGKTVVCPMHADLENHLLALPVKGTDPKAQLTPALAGKEVGGRNGLSREFKDIMKKAKVDDGRIEGTGEKGRAFSQLSFHALRHSHVSHLANAGVADEIRMKLSGHTNGSVHGKYTKLQLDPLRAAIAKLPSVTKGHCVMPG